MFRKLFSSMGKPAVRQPEAPPASSAPAPVVPLCHPRELSYAFTGLLLGSADENGHGADKPLNAVERRVRSEVENLLARGLGPQDLPRLPATIPQLLEGLDQERHAREIAEIINRDPALAGEIVSLANSPCFRRSSEPVKTVEAAFAHVGENGIRALLIASRMRQTFDIRPVYFRLFGRLLWQHALDCAQASSLFARKAGVDSAVAFFTGLVHDMGKLVVFQRALAAFCTEVPDAPLRPLVFQGLIDEFSHRLTRDVCASWHIPAEIKDAIAQQAPSQMLVASPLAQVLFTANAVAETHMLLSERAVPRARLIEYLREHGVPWMCLYEAFPEHREARTSGAADMRNPGSRQLVNE